MIDRIWFYPKLVRSCAILPCCSLWIVHRQAIYIYEIVHMPHVAVSNARCPVLRSILHALPDTRNKHAASCGLLQMSAKS